MRYLIRFHKPQRQIRCDNVKFHWIFKRPTKADLYYYEYAIINLYFVLLNSLFIILSNLHIINENIYFKSKGHEEMKLCTQKCRVLCPNYDPRLATLGSAIFINRCTKLIFLPYFVRGRCDLESVCDKVIRTLPK